jgi:hypothetical protein
VIWINVYPTGEIWYIWHVRFPCQPPHMWHIRFLWAVHVHINLSRSRQQHWTELLLLRKSDSRLHPSTLVDLSAGPYSINLQVPTQFLSPHSHWSSRGKVKHLLPTDYIGLLDPYLQHVISMFNTCSWVPTPQSLTNLGRGYNLRGAGFSHHSLRPSQSTLLCFALMAPSDLRLTFSSTNQPQK